MDEATRKDRPIHVRQRWGPEGCHDQGRSSAHRHIRRWWVNVSSLCERALLATEASIRVQQLAFISHPCDSLELDAQLVVSIISLCVLNSMPNVAPWETYKWSCIHIPTQWYVYTQPHVNRFRYTLMWGPTRPDTSAWYFARQGVRAKTLTHVACITLKAHTLRRVYLLAKDNGSRNTTVGKYFYNVCTIDTVKPIYTYTPITHVYICMRLYMFYQAAKPSTPMIQLVNH